STPRTGPRGPTARRRRRTVGRRTDPRPSGPRWPRPARCAGSGAGIGTPRSPPVELGPHGLEQLGPGVVELLQSLDLELVDDLLVRDALRFEVGDHQPGLVGASGDRVAVDLAVVR